MEDDDKERAARHDRENTVRVARVKIGDRVHGTFGWGTVEAILSQSLRVRCEYVTVTRRATSFTWKPYVEWLAEDLRLTALERGESKG